MWGSLARGRGFAEEWWVELVLEAQNRPASSIFMVVSKFTHA
jgi:hypothetical protein